MGIEDRQYYREDEASSWGGSGATTAWKWIIGLTIGVFLAQVVTNNAVARWLWLDAGDLWRGQLWRLVTYGFCHDTRDILHIIFNLLFLYWFGAVLEGMLGFREFLRFYLAAVLIAGLAFLGLDALMTTRGYVVGASGGVMAVMALYAWHYPRQKILLFFLIPVEIWLVVALYVAFDLLPLLNELQGQGSTGVAHAAHLGGLAFGLAYGKFGWRLEGWSPRWPERVRLPRRRPDLKVYDPRTERAELDREVDAILTKISQSGEGSLTAKERKRLQEASRRYRKPI